MTQQLGLCGAGTGSVLTVPIPAGLNTARVFPAQHPRPGLCLLCQVHKWQRCNSSLKNLLLGVIFYKKK